MCCGYWLTLHTSHPEPAFRLQADHIQWEHCQVRGLLVSVVIQISLKGSCAVRVFTVFVMLVILSGVAEFENCWPLCGVWKKYKCFPSYYLGIQKQRCACVAASSLWAFVYTFKESRILLVQESISEGSHLGAWRKAGRSDPLLLIWHHGFQVLSVPLSLWILLVLFHTPAFWLPKW